MINGNIVLVIFSVNSLTLLSLNRR